MGVVERWYVRHIVERVPPEPDGSKAAAEIIAAAWPRERQQLRAADLGDELLVRQVLAAKATTKAAKKEEARLCQLLQRRIGDAEGIRGADFKATWTYQGPTEVQAHTREGGRVLRVTGPKGED